MIFVLSINQPFHPTLVPLDLNLNPICPRGLLVLTVIACSVNNTRICIESAVQGLLSYRELSGQNIPVTLGAEGMNRTN